MRDDYAMQTLERLAGRADRRAPAIPMDPALHARVRHLLGQVQAAGLTRPTRG